MWEGFFRFQRHVFGSPARLLCGAAGAGARPCGSAAQDKWEGGIRIRIRIRIRLSIFRQWCTRQLLHGVPGRLIGKSAWAHCGWCPGWAQVWLWRLLCESICKLLFVYCFVCFVFCFSKRVPCAGCWVFFGGWPGSALALALALGCVGECRLARLGLRLAHSGSPAVAARNSAPGVHCPVRHPALLRVVEDACAVVAADELATRALATPVTGVARAAGVGNTSAPVTLAHQGAVLLHQVQPARVGCAPWWLLGASCPCSLPGARGGAQVTFGLLVAARKERHLVLAGHGLQALHAQGVGVARPLLASPGSDQAVLAERAAGPLTTER